MALVELVVVDLVVVRVNALQEQVARLLEERVNREVEVVDRRVQGLPRRVVAQLANRRRVLERVGLGRLGDLVKEGCEEVRVVDGDGELLEDILERELGLLQATIVNISSHSCWSVGAAYLSVVNLPSLYAAMKLAESLKARRLREPWELRLTSCTRATVLSLSFW